MDEPVAKRLKLSHECCDAGSHFPSSQPQTVSNSCSGSSSLQNGCHDDATTTCKNMTRGVSDGETVSNKVLTMQRILVAVLHARCCCVNPCPEPCCAAMKQVLTHLASCKDGKSCHVPHCRSTRQIVEHFTSCQLDNCPVCSVIRRPQDAPQSEPSSEHQQPSVEPYDKDTKISSSMEVKHSTDDVPCNSTQQRSSDEGCSSTSVTKKPMIRPLKRVFTAEELREHLLPTWTVIYEMYPHSAVFRQPVDPVLERIPDYPLIVKQPMDLSTICRNLQDGHYTDPWQYVDDMQLMFSNAWLYNRRSSPVYKSCTKLAERFESIIDEPMRALGCCCGQKPRFRPMPLYCNSATACCIPVNSAYYSSQDKFVFCEKCFVYSRGEVLEVFDSPTQPPLKMHKDEFKRVINSTLEPESYVQCVSCSRRQHQICVMHHDQIWSTGYVCEPCLQRNRIVRRTNPYTAQKLVQTELGSHLENRVNAFLRRNGVSSDGEITVRVLACSSKTTELKPQMRRRFPDAAANFPYTAKGIFAFQRIDGDDVCFLGLHVQEYGSDSPPPNHRRVYLAYLDSVKLFRPAHIRTAVYHELLLAYFEYVRNLGFLYVHIWACPPVESDDYVFHRHPDDQKIPKPKRLQDWYRNLLDHAINKGIIADYKDIAADALMAGLATAMDIPYFEGDFWPNTLEEVIMSEEHDKNVTDETVDHSANVDGPTTESTGGKSQCKVGKAKKSKKSCKGRKPGGRKGAAMSLIDKLLTSMDKHKEMFFIVHLLSPRKLDAPLRKTVDPDPVFGGELADGRGPLLMYCRERRLEFSSLRRARYSTMVFLYEIHQEQINSVRGCTRCSAKIVFARRCTQCDDVLLCKSCYEKYSHEHKMTTWVYNTDRKAATRRGDEDSEVIQRCIDTVGHATTCTLGDACPRQPECRKMSDVLRHARSCTARPKCNVCQQLVALCVTHARTCTQDPAICRIPFCADLRRHFERRRSLQQQQQRLTDDQRRAVVHGVVPMSTPVTEEPDSRTDVCDESDHTYSGKCPGTGQQQRDKVIPPAVTSSTNSRVDTSASLDVTSMEQSSKTATTLAMSASYSAPAISRSLSNDVNRCGNSEVGQTRDHSNPENSICRSPDQVENSTAASTVTLTDTKVSSARHQVVITCLRALMKLNPGMAKHDILQLLCQCSRRQLTALHHRLLEADIWNGSSAVVRCPSNLNASPPSVPARVKSSTTISHKHSRSALRHLNRHRVGYQQLIDIINLPRSPPGTTCTQKSATGPPDGDQTTPRSSSDEPFRPPDVLARLVDKL